jgi:hypothetical protein
MSERIKLYLDEDAQRTDLIQALRARNVDVMSASEASLLGAMDDVQLRFATEQGRVIFTFNRGDFFHLHTEWLRSALPHSGIIVSDQVGTGAVTRRLLRLINARSPSAMRNWLEFLSNWQ